MNYDFIPAVIRDLYTGKKAAELFHLYNLLVLDEISEEDFVKCWEKATGVAK